jgi:hypothetical protein
LYQDVQAGSLKTGIAVCPLQRKGGKRVIAHTVTVFEQQEIVGGELAWQDHPCSAKPVASGTDGGEWIFRESDRCQIACAEGESEHRGVQLSRFDLAQQLRGPFLFQMEFKPMKGAA